MARAYTIKSGPTLTQFDAEGKRHDFKVGDQIALTDEEAEALGERVEPVAPVAPAAELDPDYE